MRFTHLMAFIATAGISSGLYLTLVTTLLHGLQDSLMGLSIMVALASLGIATLTTAVGWYVRAERGTTTSPSINRALVRILNVIGVSVGVALLTFSTRDATWEIGLTLLIMAAALVAGVAPLRRKSDRDNADFLLPYLWPLLTLATVALSLVTPLLVASAGAGVVRNNIIGSVVLCAVTAALAAIGRLRSALAETLEVSPHRPAVAGN